MKEVLLDDQVTTEELPLELQELQDSFSRLLKETAKTQEEVAKLLGETKAIIEDVRNG